MYDTDEILFEKFATSNNRVFLSRLITS